MKIFIKILILGFIESSISYDIIDLTTKLQDPRNNFVYIPLEGARTKDVNLLIQAMNNSQIPTLYIENNDETNDELAIPIINILTRTKTTTLYFTKLGNDGTTAIAKILKDTAITVLCLRESGISDRGIIEIALGLSGSEITLLDLKSNKISNEGVFALAEALKYTKITKLDLQSNKISDGGAFALAEVLQSTKLVSLNLAYNAISKVGAEALRKIERNTGIEINLPGYKLTNDEMRDTYRRDRKNKRKPE